MDNSWAGEALFENRLDGQTPQIKTSLSFAFTVVPSIKTYFQVSMQGTEVNPAKEGNIKYDNDDARGWYTDQIDVYMNLSADNAKNLDSKIKVRTDAPQTAQRSTSITSDTTFSVMAAPGSPMISYSMGTAISRNLQDFEVVNLSSLYEIRHSYILAATSGGSYKNPNDLVSEPLSFKHLAVGGLIKDSLYELPPLSKSNFPVISQGIWEVDSDFRGKANLIVRVSHYLKKAQTIQQGLPFVVPGLSGYTKVFSEHKEWSYNLEFTIDFSEFAVLSSSIKQTQYEWAKAD